MIEKLGENALKPVENVALDMTTTKGLGALMDLASKLAGADIIPASFKGKPANVLIALNMANRMHADPFAVMQNMYVVYGNPSFSSKFLIACFNGCGKYSSIRYKFNGQPNTDDWTCRAYAYEIATGELLEGPAVSIGLAKKEGWYGKSGSKWQTMPEMMMRYRAAAFLIKTCAPELSFGMQTKEEAEDIIDVDGSEPNNRLDSARAEINRQIENTTEAPVVEMPVPTKATEPAKAEVPNRPSWAQ